MSLRYGRVFVVLFLVVGVAMVPRNRRMAGLGAQAAEELGQVDEPPTDLDVAANYWCGRCAADCECTTATNTCDCLGDVAAADAAGRPQCRGARFICLCLNDGFSCDGPCVCGGDGNCACAADEDAARLQNVLLTGLAYPLAACCLANFILCAGLLFLWLLVLFTVSLDAKRRTARVRRGEFAFLDPYFVKLPSVAVAQRRPSSLHASTIYEGPSD